MVSHPQEFGDLKVVLTSGMKITTVSNGLTAVALLARAGWHVRGPRDAAARDGCTPAQGRVLLRYCLTCGQSEL